MTSVPLIHYWGPVAAGRATSIGSLVDEGGGVVFGEQDYVPAAYDKRVALRFSSVATKVFYRAEDRTRPAPLLPVIANLAAAIGIVFVADSQASRRMHNLGSLARLRADLEREGVCLDDIPVVFQLNKRDLPDVMPLLEMRRELRTARCDYVESIASERHGTDEPIYRVLEMVGL